MVLSMLALISGYVYVHFQSPVLIGLLDFFFWFP